MSGLRVSLARLLTIGALSLSAAALFVPSDAAASVSIAVAYDALVKDADAVAVITAGEGSSVWEDGRIYTYTKLHVDQGVAGDMAAGSDVYVRTMGGVVGKIGQMVDGEPVFIKDKPSLLFLRKFKPGGAFEVSARAQGQYPIARDETTKKMKLLRSSVAGMLLPPKVQPDASGAQTQSKTPLASSPADVKPTDVKTARLAHDVLHEKLLDDGVREIAAHWTRMHPALVVPQ